MIKNYANVTDLLSGSASGQEMSSANIKAHEDKPRKVRTLTAQGVLFKRQLLDKNHLHKTES